MSSAGGTQIFPSRNQGEGRRPSSLQSSIQRNTLGFGPGAYEKGQLEPSKGYAPNRQVDRSMTMTDKGPGSFWRAKMVPTENTVDNAEERQAFLLKGAYTQSARTDRSTLSFGKGNDHPRWDPRRSVSDSQEGGLQERRQRIAVEHLSSGEVGISAPGHLFTRAKPTGGEGLQTRLGKMAGPDRQRLLESGAVGAFDLTAQIHEARRAYRREQKRERHAKQLSTVTGKHSTEALTPGAHYLDHDARMMCAPSGIRARRVGLGTVATLHGSESRAALQRQAQESGSWGRAVVTGAGHGQYDDSNDSAEPPVHIQPSGRKDRYLGEAVDGRPCEPGTKGRLRHTRPKNVNDLSKSSAAQIGQFWSHHGDQWWLSHSHQSHTEGPNDDDEDDRAGNDDEDADDGHGGVTVKGGVPHWHAYPSLYQHVPGASTARDVAQHHREQLTSGICGSHVSARGPRPTQTVDFNEPHGCPLHPSTNVGAGFKPPLGPTTDGLPIALKPFAPRHPDVSDWVNLATDKKKGVHAHDHIQGFHKSSASSLLAASQLHSRGDAPTVGITGTRTAREKSRRATVEREIGASADIGWSHVLRGQKW